MQHQLHFAFIYRQSWPLLRPAWKGKEVEVKIVQTTIQQISANPARPQSMQPNIFIRRKYLKKTGDFLEKFLIWCELPAAINLLSISLLLVSIWMKSYHICQINCFRKSFCTNKDLGVLHAFATLALFICLMNENGRGWLFQGQSYNFPDGMNNNPL